jgi:A118 family predicted phage portal protein
LKVDQDDMSIKDITHDIRTESYVGAINQFFKTLEMQTKLSVGTFSFDGASVKTATEVVSENSMTYRTRNSHIIEVEKFIKELIVSVFELASKTIGKDGNHLYDGEIPTFEEIGIDFDDGIFVDKNQQLDYYSKVKSSKFMPDIEIMQRLFKIPEETAIEWSKRISEEELQSNPDHAETIAAVSMLGPEEV